MKKSSYLSNFFSNLYSIFQKNKFMSRLKILLYYFDTILLAFIKKPVQNKSNKKKVLCVYNIALGDGILWLCAARNLRKIYPSNKFELTLVCQEGLQRIYQNENIFDIIIPLDFNKGTYNSKVRFSILKKIRKNYYDIVLDPIGCNEWTTNVLITRASVSSKKIGILDYNYDQICSDKSINKIYDQIVLINQKKISLLQIYLIFINSISNKKLHLLPQKMKFPNVKLNIKEKYFIIFPSAGLELKKWPLERYAEIAKRIYSKTKIKMLLCGTNHDKNTTDEFKKLIDIPYLDYVGKTSLEEFITIIQNSELVVSNDTGAYHIAAVAQVPVAIITGGYTYDKYVRYDFDGDDKFKKPYIIVNKRDCFNCNNKCDKLKKEDKIWPCLNEISIEDAWKVIDKMIDDNID